MKTGRLFDAAWPATRTNFVRERAKFTSRESDREKSGWVLILVDIPDMQFPLQLSRRGQAFGCGADRYANPRTY